MSKISVPLLHRLLNKRDAVAVLQAFQGLMPEAILVLMDIRDELMASTGQPFDVETIPGEELSRYPIFAGSQPVGTLGINGRFDENAARALQNSLQLLVTAGVEKREIAQETLERYHEINLLYRVGDTIGLHLQEDAIPPLILTEAARVIDSDISLILMPDEVSHLSLVVKAASGSMSYISWLQDSSQAVIERVESLGYPDIAAKIPIEGASTGAVLCAPLKGRESLLGFALLGRLDSRRMFTAGDEKLLMAITRQAGTVIEAYRLQQQELERQLLENELAVGKQIQLSLLPAAVPAMPGWEFAAFYQSARQVGGDFYDFFHLPQQRLGIVIADVTGKGVPAAMFMAVSRTVIRGEARTGRSPSDVLEQVNQIILEDNRSRLFLTAFYAILDTQAGTLQFASAGHDYPVWARSNGDCRLLDIPGYVLGAFQGIHLEEKTIALVPGDCVVFYTDGVTEARNTQGELFEETRLMQTITRAGNASAEEILQTIIDAVTAFVGNRPQSDDLTLFVIKRQR